MTYIRGTVLDKVLDQNAPGDGPLLQRDHTATDLPGSNLTLVDGHNAGCDADGHASDDTTGTQHPAVYGCALDDGADDPQDAGDLEGDLSREAVGEERAAERANETAGGHRGRDGSLGVAILLRVVEVSSVGLGSEHTTHGRYVKAKQGASCVSYKCKRTRPFVSTNKGHKHVVVLRRRLLCEGHTYGGKAADKVDIARLIHLAVYGDALLSFATNWLVVFYRVATTSSRQLVGGCLSDQTVERCSRCQEDQIPIRVLLLAPQGLRD